MMILVSLHHKTTHKKAPCFHTPILKRFMSYREFFLNIAVSLPRIRPGWSCIVFKGGHRCYDAKTSVTFISRKHESFFYRNHNITNITCRS